MASRIYLDHAATTPVLPQAQAAVAEGLARWANPSSPHAEGRAARAALEQARARIGAALGWKGAVILTSGATEALGLAMVRSVARTRLMSAVEHDALFRVATTNHRIGVGADGRVDPDELAAQLHSLEGPALVAVQAANNETGVLQPLDAIAAAVREAGGWLLADCAQSAGKLSLPNADFIALSAHKLGGPPGVGALLVRELALLQASGGQEKGYRPGTENLPAALGFAAALDAQRDWLDRAAELRRHLEHALLGARGMVVAQGTPRIATIGAYRMPGVPAASQLIQFDLAGIAVSAGSACSSGSLRPSHVLGAMGWPEQEAREVIRVSFGPATSRGEIDEFVRVWTRMAADAKARAA